MVTAAAVVRGDRERLLGFRPAERPLALQLGGAEPAALAEAARVGRDFGFDEINLNVGCPSDRVQSGCFGAALMRTPELVADCVAAMIEAAGPVPVTVKCRIGVDEQDPEAVLPAFLATLAAAGVRRVAIHARKAWLEGLSPKQNREIPPLDHGLVLRMKRAFPDLAIVVNGGIADLDQARGFLARGLDGVMIGRAAYQAPALLGAADRLIFGEAVPDVGPEAAVRAMLPYIEAERARGTGLQPDHPPHARRLPGPARRPGLAADAVGERPPAGRGARSSSSARSPRWRPRSWREPSDRPPVRRVKALPD